jgi:serine/threonine protein phosphatase PrpC
MDRSEASPAQALIDAALRARATDNVTAVAVEAVEAVEAVDGWHGDDAD